MESFTTGERANQEETHPVAPDSEVEPPSLHSNSDLIDMVESEAEALRKELALFQSELDSIQDRVAAIHRESSSLAATLRRQGEEQAREIVARAEQEAQKIIQRAVAKAELVELRAKVRAEETRARAVARLWSRMEASRGNMIGGRRFTVEDVNAQVSAELAHLELKEDRDSAELVRESRWEDRAELAGESRTGNDLAAQQTVDENTLGAGDTEPLGTQQTAVERKFRIAERLSFASMLALEENIRSLPGVAAASITPVSDGGTLLSVVSTDPDSVAQRLAETPGLPAFQEAT